MAGFDKLVFAVNEIFESKGGEKVVVLGYYHFRFHGRLRNSRHRSLTFGQSAKAGR